MCKLDQGNDIFVSSGLESDVALLNERVIVKGWEIPRPLINTVIASIVLDFILAGSELFHRIRVKHR